MNLLKHLPGWIKNKYLLTLLGFTVWIVFIDDRDLITTHFRRAVELRRLEESRKFYEMQVAATQKELEQLKNDPGRLEKYAREKYLMKRDNEDVYLIGHK